MWWIDEGRLTACCRLTKLEDGDEFDCDTCGVEHWLAALDDDNVEAWRVFNQISTRFVVDRGATAVVLEPILRGREPWDAEDLIDRLSILHDAIYPAKGSPDGA